MNGKLIQRIQIKSIDSNQKGYEMSHKSLYQTLIALGLFAIFILAVRLGVTSNAAPSIGGRVAAAQALAGSDFFERHASGLGIFVGFDRDIVDSAKLYAGSDWVERNPSKYYTGSDWIERHPPILAKAAYYRGSDFFERHRPSAFLKAVKIDENFDVPLWEREREPNKRLAPVPVYRSRLDECFDVPLNEQAICSSANQAIVP